MSETDSHTVTSIPARCRLRAAVNPPMPPPIISAFVVIVHTPTTRLPRPLPGPVLTRGCQASRHLTSLRLKDTRGDFQEIRSCRMHPKKSYWSLYQNVMG